MGCKSSSLRRKPDSWFDRTRHKVVSSLLCGASTSKSSAEVEECNPAKSSITSLENLAPISDISRTSISESSSAFGAESRFTSSETEVVISTEELSDPLNTVDNATANRTTDQETPHEDNTSRSEVNVDDASFLLGTYTARLDRAASRLRSAGRSERDSSTRGLHLDLVSISSNSLPSNNDEINNRETRRNSRRQFWDALSSRRGFRRNDDSSSSTLVFMTGSNTDDLGSRDRWLLDFNGDLHYDGRPRDHVYSGANGRRWSERRRQARSAILERINHGLNEEGNQQQATFCASGLHPNGTCSCDSLAPSEESGTLASISWIVMLAEALFEVLDEVHNQPFSLSLASLPAPESIVNSFPIKSHQKLVTADGILSNEEQCHICLDEYEEGEKIRVLPCRHEYHMVCVDKWLKEVHGVCPLCRSNVCEGSASSNTEIETR
ncbi:uncharacterized protein LOC124942685 [Impatiens glandulifera]|uniref:uncharacterized protein LOC124942685 n=1 Tax=Impatiens glandulifera TaxID=253017 RepID=UPI001FB083AB|nr:uncharacterized protein LOC124942685 [Impatiens glandulifera]